MKNTWKGLAAIAVSAALVVAPLSMSAALAEETPPPTETVDVGIPTPAVEETTPVDDVVTEPVAEEPVVADPPAVVSDPEPVVSDPEPVVTDPVTPPADPQPPVATRPTVAQGYVLALWKADNGTEPWPQHLVGSVKTVSQLLDALDGLALDCGSFYQADLYADDETTASLLAGGFLNSPNHPAESWPGGYYKSWFSKQWTTKPCPEVIEVTPTAMWTPPSCDEAGVLTLGPEEGVAWGAVPNEETGGTVYTASPTEGYKFPDDVQTQWDVPNLSQLDPNDPQCVQTYPLPAQFSADPEPAGCEVSGSFSTGFLGEPVTDDGEGTSTYVFENVDVMVVRTDGGVFLKVTAHPGFVLDGLNPEKWDVSGDGLFAERFITIAPATGFQSDDPEAPCFLAAPLETTLAQPTIDDPCGTANDFAFTPADTDTVTYDWASNDPADFDIVATVAEGYVVTGEHPGWQATENDASIWTFAWSPTFTDVACDGDTPPGDDTVPPTKVTGTPTGLAATGSSTNYLPWAIGALAGMFAGMSLMAFRKALAR